jgi:hypothetical protein
MEVTITNIILVQRHHLIHIVSLLGVTWCHGNGQCLGGLSLPNFFLCNTEDDEAKSLSQLDADANNLASGKSQPCAFR